MYHNDGEDELIHGLIDESVYQNRVPQNILYVGSFTIIDGMDQNHVGVPYLINNDSKIYLLVELFIF